MNEITTAANSVWIARSRQSMLELNGRFLETRIELGLLSYKLASIPTSDPPEQKLL